MLKAVEKDGSDRLLFLGFKPKSGRGAVGNTAGQFQKLLAIVVMVNAIRSVIFRLPWFN